MKRVKECQGLRLDWDDERTGKFIIDVNEGPYRKSINLRDTEAKEAFGFLKSIFKPPDKPILSFKQLVALWPGYQKLSKETRQIVREMMEGQEQGGPVGSSPQELP